MKDDSDNNNSQRKEDNENSVNAPTKFVGLHNHTGFS